MSKSIIFAVLASLGVTAFTLWRVHAMNTATIDHFAILYDPSISFTGGCESAVGSAEELLHVSRVSGRSKLTLLVLGDRTSANEPRQVGRYAFPVSRKVIEGQESAEREQATLLQEISDTCNSVGRTSISPIFMGVRQAVADLRAEGCTEASQCELIVDSDLEENVETGLRNTLDHAHSRYPLPRPVQNAGISVTFCGYASTAGRIIDPTGREVRRFGSRDPAREERMLRTWRSIFTSPEEVKFEPYCAKSSDPGRFKVARVSNGPAEHN